MPDWRTFTRFTGRMCLLILFSTLLSGCTVVKVADVAASTAIGVTAGTVKLTGKAIGAAIPDGDDEEEEEEESKQENDD